MTTNQSPAIPLNNDEFVIIDGKTIVFANVDAHVVRITPEVAAMLLLRNNARKSNRPIDQGNLCKLLTDVQNDDFTYNGASFVLSTDGDILDGQHRLTAIVQTGVTLVAVIATGVQVKAQRDMDSGKARTLADNLTMDSELYPSTLAAVLIGLQAWERGERSTHQSSRGTTINTSYHFLEKHPETRQIAKEAFTLATKIPGFGPKPLAQFMWAFDKLSVRDRKDFFDKLASGAGLPEGDPILQLRNFLQKDAQSAATVTPHHRAAMLCRAWNMYRAGDARKQKLAFRAGGAKPEAFPEPQ
jgi:hypothetical protein